MSGSCAAMRRVRGLVAALAYAGAVLLSAAPAVAGEPFTQLYDAPAEAAEGLSEEALSQKKAWLPVKENDTTHRIKGCAVFLNAQFVFLKFEDRLGILTGVIVLSQQFGIAVKLAVAQRL